MVQGGGAPFFFPGEYATLSATILSNWQHWYLYNEELELVKDWGILIEQSRGCVMPYGTKWIPGYDDYEDIIVKLLIFLLICNMHYDLDVSIGLTTTHSPNHDRADRRNQSLNHPA